MSEVLFQCPHCKRSGYTGRGLRSHCCPELPGKGRLSKESIAQAVAVTSGPGSISLQQRINAWQAKTFAVRTPSGTINHLRREFIEFTESNCPKEAADIVLLLFQHADLHGYDLLAEVEQKFEIVQRRKWGKPDQHGVYEHDRNLEDK